MLGMTLGCFSSDDVDFVFSMMLEWIWNFIILILNTLARIPAEPSCMLHSKVGQAPPEKMILLGGDCRGDCWSLYRVNVIQNWKLFGTQFILNGRPSHGNDMMMIQIFVFISSVNWCVWMYVYTCVCVCTNMCVYMCVCMCVHVSACLQQSWKLTSVFFVSFFVPKRGAISFS